MRHFIVNTGEQETVYLKIDEFFGDIINKIEPLPQNRPTQIRIRRDFIYDSHTESYSDDIVHRLFYKTRSFH